MSAAANSSDRPQADRQRRMRLLVAWLDRAMINGRIPAFLIVIVTGLMLWAFLFTNDFRVEAVTVDGLDYGDGSEVVAHAELLDRSTFRAQPELVAARIAELPYVESVAVEVRFPDAAWISIVERKPVLNVEDDGNFTLVSSEADAIATGFVEGLPVLQLDRSGVADAEPLAPAVVSAAAAVASVYGPDSALVWNPDIGLVMNLTGGRLVNFGGPDSIESKLTVLAAIEDQVDDSWTQLDLSVPTRPAYR